MIAAAGGGVSSKARSKVESAGRAERSFIEMSAAKHIVSYFRDLPVPSGVNLVDKRYVGMCVESNICDAVDMAYKCMKSRGSHQGSCGDGTIGEDVRFVVRLLRDIRLKCVPQEFSAGILLMHLEIMEGLSF
jgi:hypothetical protein